MGVPDNMRPEKTEISVIYLAPGFLLARVLLSTHFNDLT